MTLAHGGGIQFVRIPNVDAGASEDTTARFYKAYSLAGPVDGDPLKVVIEDEARMERRDAVVQAAFPLPTGINKELIYEAAQVAHDTRVPRAEDAQLTVNDVYQQIRLYDRIVEPLAGERVPISPETLDTAGEKLTAVISDAPIPMAPAHTVPVAYTYFGQFLAHDMSWMKLDQTIDTTGIGAETAWTNGRHGHALSFDTLFGTRPPEGTPTSPWHEAAGAALGITSGDSELAMDLPRSGTNGISCAADLRTDTNLALAQMHVLLARFHLAGWDLEGGTDNNAMRRTREHLQAAVLTDYLPRIIPSEIYDDVMDHGRKVVAPPEKIPADYTFELPVEFAAACFRFGHSIVNDPYTNWIIKYPPGSTLKNAPAYIENLFHYTAKGEDLDEGRLQFHWAQYWRHMVDNANGALPATVVATPIRAELRNAMNSLESSQFPPDGTIVQVPEFNLAQRTLHRGEALGLPSGQRLHQVVFDALGDAVTQPLDIQAFLSANTARFGTLSANSVFCDSTPLWFYVLAEAEAANTGKLGPVAARVVMETIHAALEFSKVSIISVADGLTTNNFQRAYRVDKGAIHNFSLTDVVALAYGEVDAPI